MGDFFYYLFVFPLENLLGLLFNFIFSFVPSLGVSIVLLSFLVNVFLLKITLLSEKRAAFENARKKEMDTRIQNWKTVYQHAKLFAFTQTLYRQKHYHPIFLLTSLGGLFIQIPFFYAMYFVVYHYPLSTGETLAQIQHITALDQFGDIYILPFIMTLITLFNVFLSSVEKNARLQGSFIAFLFLILLYKMPSALVLYWTSNMVFALFKTIFRQLSALDIE